MSKNKKWDKPMLLILTRGNPEEVVLASCKQNANGAGGAAASAHRNMCMTSSGPFAGDCWSAVCFGIGIS